MTEKLLHKLQVGEPVRFETVYQRVWTDVPRSRRLTTQETRKGLSWEPVTFIEKEGYIVGLRTVSDGWTEYDDGYTTWVATRHKRLYLVSWDLYQRPVHVAPGDLIYGHN